MKILQIALLPLTLSFIEAQRAPGCLRQDPSFELNFEGKCDIDHVRIAIKEEIAVRPNSQCYNWKRELMDLFQMSYDDVVVQIGIICAKGEEDVFEDVNFYDILDLEDSDGDEKRFMKEFYDGGTRLNEEYDDLNEGHSLASDTQSIKDFYDNELSTSTVSFPEDIENFEECTHNTVMCCYIQDRQIDDSGGCNQGNCIDKNPGDNTDICYVDHERSPGSSHVEGGFTVYDEAATNGGEGPVHCHGFAWSTDDNDFSSRYRGNTLSFVSLYDHLYLRGYVRNVPGAPMCGCIEQMPTVSKAQCTQVESVETVVLTYDEDSYNFEADITNPRLAFEKCDGDTKKNDLAAHIRLEQSEGRMNVAFPSEFLVETCADTTSAFLASKGIQRI